MDEHKRICFIRASTLRLKTTESSKRKVKCSLNGEEVKSFYESIVGSKEELKPELTKDSNEACSSLPSGIPSKSSRKRRQYKRPIHGSKTKDVNIDKHDSHRVNSQVNKIKPLTGEGRGISLKNDVSPNLYYNTSQDSPCKYMYTVTPSRGLPVQCTSWGLSDVRAVSGWLRCVQKGNLSELDHYSNAGQDLDVQDMHGWTALMVAAHAGQKSAVKWLIQNGANVDILTPLGQSAYDIAKIAGHHSVFEVPQKLPKTTTLENFFCETCGQEFKETTQELHHSSTMHQFSLKHSLAPTSYSIPESNRGFQMMLREGWDMA